MRVQYGTSKIANSSDNSYGIVSNTGNELLNAFDMNYVISPDEKPFIRSVINGKDCILFDPSTLYAVQYSSNKSKRIIVRMEDNSNAR